MKGITEGIKTLMRHCQPPRSRKCFTRGFRNKLRDITVHGIVLYRPLLGQAKYYAELQEQVDFFRFFPLEKGVALGARFAQAKRKDDVRRLWESMNAHLLLGNTVDRTLKYIFTGQLSTVPSVYIGLTDTLLSVLEMELLTADVRVASHAEPLVDPNYADLHSCSQCNAVPTGHVTGTAVDLLGWRAETDQVVLVEVKTHKNDTVERGTLRRMLLQAWLTHLIFMITYRQLLPHRVVMKLAVVLITVGCVQFYNVPHHLVTPNMLKIFPFLRFICLEKMAVLLPHYTPSRRIYAPFAVVSLKTGQAYRAQTPAEHRQSGQLGPYRRRVRPKMLRCRAKGAVVQAVAQQQVEPK